MSSTTDHSDNLRTSENFRASDADVIFKSSDNVLFHIHRRNLETQAEAFPPSEFDTRDEIIPLTEDASTLENLFQYIYPQPRPDVDLVPFEQLYKLAESAEKYEVYSVMQVCRMRIRGCVSSYPIEIFNYASKHDYRDIMAMAVPFLLDIAPDELVTKLLPHLIIPWVRFRTNWIRTVRNAIIGRRYCPACRSTADMATVYKLWTELGDKCSRTALCSMNGRVICSCFRAYPVGNGLSLDHFCSIIAKFETFL